jgi:hypothetical protein
VTIDRSVAQMRHESANTALDLVPQLFADLERHLMTAKKTADTMLRTTQSTPGAEDAPTGVRGPASYFPSIERTYGKPIADWKNLIRATGITKHMELVGWLKAEHAMGHGHANALVAHTLAEDNTTKP